MIENVKVGGEVLVFNDVNKPVIVINGVAGVGKDALLDIIQEYKIIHRFDSVGVIKEVAQRLGWNGVKDDKGRLFLSELKALAVKHVDHSLKNIEREVTRYFKSPYYDHMYLHVREPEEIERIKRAFPNVITVLVKRDIDIRYANSSDANAENFVYDYTIHNYGTLDDLRVKAHALVDYIEHKTAKL